jgi:subtilase family serine protease
MRIRFAITAAAAAAIAALGPALPALALPAVSSAPIAAAAAARYRDLGRAPAQMPVRLAVVLAYRNEGELQALLAAQDDAASPLAGHYLTQRQFLDAFAPSLATYAAVERDLAARGFTVVRTYANRTMLDVSAPAATVERTFSTELHRASALGRSGYANVRPAFLPSELRASIAGVVGFDGVGVLHAANHRGAAQKNALGPPLQGPDTGFSPYALANAYDLPVQHGKDGLGQSAAVVIDADFLDTDLARFLKAFGVTRSGPPTTRIPIDGGPKPAINGDSVEASLDVEAIVGTAPGTSLYVYEASSLAYATILDTYNQVVSDNSAGAVNSSFGGCETETSPSNYPQMTEKIAQQGAALGIVFAASTGDSGTYACTYPGPGGVSTPASSPSFVAVGGTTLVLKAGGAYNVEFGWSGSGGGVSALFARPSYQKGLRGALGKFRNLPDAGFDGDPGSGMALYFRNRWSGPIGGTSLSSPIFTAFCVELAQIAGHRVGGDIHSSIYAAFAKYGYKNGGTTYFRDATFGNNGYYNARPGYDQVTGIGSIDGWNFASVAKVSSAQTPAADAAAASGRRFAVVLKLHGAAGLEALIRSQSDPSSPLYAHFLSVEAFRNAFAPTPAEYAAAVAALQRQGFAIEATSPNRTLIDVRGGPALGQAMRASLPFVQSIIGVDTARARTATSALQRGLQPLAAGRPVGPDGGFGPLAVTAGADFPVRHGVTGTGVTVAEVIDGAPSQTDLATFAKQFGVRVANPNVTVVAVDGGKGFDVLQPDVDFEWLSAAAPGVKQVVYDVPQLGAKEAFDAYTRVVSDNAADVVNASWGACDSAFVTLGLALQPVLAQGAAQGIAFEGVEFGAPCGGWKKPLPMSPGDTANGLAVGGSYVTENVSQQILNQTALIGSNGGVSILVPVPPEQKGVAGVSPLGRNAPDIVIPATVNGAGASIYAGGAWIGGGAFVNNAPAAGLMATLQQMSGHRLGALDRTLYTLLKKQKYGGIFTDITAGCNGSFGGVPICAAPGFDLSTGIGAVDGYKLGKAL